MRRINGRALQQERRRFLQALAAAVAVGLLAGCVNEGILPREELPPAPATQLPTPGFNAPAMPDEEERGVLTPVEREALEDRLSGMAQSRQKGVERGIQEGAPKAKQAP